MIMYYIIRNNQQFGPYSIDVLRTYVESGKILKCDIAFEATNPNAKNTVGYYLKVNHIKVKIVNKGNILAQIKDIGKEIVIPSSMFSSGKSGIDQRILVLSIIGLLPLFLMYFVGSGFLMFYTISLYFSAIWGLFFFYLFKTPQVTLKKTVLIFFGTQAFAFVVFGIGLNKVNLFYQLEYNNSFILRLLFYVFAVGLTEEFSKSLPLLIISAKSKEPIIPQTLVYYGLMSGIAFGVFEGVQYQMTVNSELDYGSGFLMNIARLTSLPFLHAVWCGIGGYFIAFAKLYPKYRLSLYFIAFSLPSLLHGVYDTFCGSILGLVISLPVSIIGVVLLMTYLKQGVNYQSKLSN